MTTWRHLELSATRLPRWWDRFTTDHPDVELTTAGGAAVLTSTDGSIAQFTGWFPILEQDVGPDAGGPDAGPDSGTLVAAANVQARLLEVPPQIGIILVRRGGFSIGLADARGTQPTLVAHKSGTRYVQGRTAAGGQSQQRFARRRDNQAEDLVRTTADRAAVVLEPVLAATSGVGLAAGGDPAMVERVLADPRFRQLRQAPRREFFDLPDPRFRVLTDVTARTSLVSVAVYNPA